MKIQHLMALVVLSLATVSGARAAVLAGPITNAANGHLYYLLSANTWTASEAEAIGLGGHLVTINDAAENQWVLSTFFPLTGGPNDWLWIGLNDAAIEGQFFWAGEESAISIWASGEPFTTDVEDYAAIGRLSGRWKDLSDTYGLENPTAPTFGVVEIAVAVTQPADQFMPGNARLNGRVSPIGSPTLAWFEWGTSLAYGNATPPQSVGSGGNVVGFSNVIVGLASGTKYHFRARASNAFGFFAGLNQTFNLGSQRPGVTSLAADQLSYTSARLKGQVNPRGWPTAAWFEWGTDTNYGNVIGMQDVGQGSSVSNLSVVLDGLVTGPIYHYRLVATNAFGAVSGADQTINLGVVPTKITWTGADPSGYWSTPANWFPNGVPTNGADLVFSGGLPPEEMVSTNDLPDSIFRSITFNQDSRHTIRGNPMTLTNRADCIINSGTNVIACDLTFSGTPSTPTFTTIRSSSFNSGELTMTGNVGGGSLYAFGGRLVIRGQFTGGTLRQYGGTLAFYGDHSHAVSVEFQGDSSTLFVQGSQPNLNITLLWEMESAACPHFTGNGVVGDVTGCGHLTLDSTLSVRNLSRGVCGTCYYNTLTIRLNGTNVGEYGKLVASGDVSVSSGGLVPSPGFNPQPGQVFTIVEKTSPGAITTAPFGPEGSLTTLNGKPFRISYVGGDGNDVTLTVESNTPPTVTITNPPAGAVFTAPASFSLAASGSDPDGSVGQVQFFVDSTSVGTDAVSPYSANATNLAPGTYTLSAVATDNQGARATNSITVIVNARPSVLAGPITNAANAHVYYLLSSNTWTASEAEASRLGGHLVTINDAAENQWVLNTFFPLTGVPYCSLWIGLNDAANEGQFVWANGEPVTFTYWYTGEPNNLGGEDYASIRHPSESPPTGSWNDLSDTSGLQNPTAPIFGVVEMPAPTPLPLAVTQPADQMMPDGSARLNGQANPSGSPTVAWFEWGTSLAYGNATPPQSVGSGNNYVGFSNVVVGLVSGTEYHFRALASNAFGFTAGLDRTFTAVTPGPIVLSGIQRPFGTQFVFSYSADVGLSYAVDRSATLSNWTTIRTDTANTNPMTVTDTAATNWMNFYRVRLLPNPPLKSEGSL